MSRVDPQLDPATDATAGRVTYALVMSVAVTAVSTAAIWVKLAGETTPLLLVCGRGLLAGLLTLPWVLAARPTRGQIGGALVAGVCLALHFWLWFSSLGLTSVAASTTLVCTTSLWLALLDVFEGRRVSVALWASIFSGLAGTFVIGLGHAGEEGGILGAFLALAGAWAAAAYMLANQRMRRGTPLIAFVSLTNLASALTCAPIVVFLAAQDALVVTDSTWWCVVLLALVPQLIGHSLLVWALRHRGGSIVTLALLGEPVIAALLAFLIYGAAELPSTMTLVGAALILPALGYALVARS